MTQMPDTGISENTVSQRMEWQGIRVSMRLLPARQARELHKINLYEQWGKYWVNYQARRSDPPLNRGTLQSPDRDSKPLFCFPWLWDGNLTSADEKPMVTSPLELRHDVLIHIIGRPPRCSGQGGLHYHAGYRSRHH
jgi:hypothetical protein